jgi:protein phosphatase
MGFFSGLLSLLGSFTRLIVMPFQAFTVFAGRLRMLNPAPILGSVGRTLRGSIAGPVRLLTGGRGLKLGKFFDFEGWRENLFARDPEKRRRRRVGQVAQFSQIHLIGGAGGARHILHIGTGIGRSTADIALRDGEGQTALLRFDRGDLPVGIEAVHVQPLTAHKVQHNGAALTPNTLVKPGDRLSLNGQDFAFEMYAWDRVPLVTRVNASYATHTGPHRQTNEDALGIYQHPKTYLFALADGVGGGEEGEQISRFAVQYLLNAFHKNVRYTLPWPDVLTKAFRYINAEVRAFSRRTPMPVGSTLTAVVIRDFQAYIAHVGDSRLMLWREGALKQITTDHVQRLPVELPTRVAFEMQEPHPLRDVLTRAIGKADGIEPELHTVALRPNDILLMMSDGVYDTLPAGEIVGVLRQLTVGHVAGALVDRSVAAGAKDNVSAIALEVLPDPFVEDVWTAETAPRIYAGWRAGWPAKLRRTTDPSTQVPVNGGGLILTIIALAGLFWLVTRIFGGAT